MTPVKSKFFVLFGFFGHEHLATRVSCVFKIYNFDNGWLHVELLQTKIVKISLRILPNGSL